MTTLEQELVAALKIIVTQCKSNREDFWKVGMILLTANNALKDLPGGE